MFEGIRFRKWMEQLHLAPQPALLSQLNPAGADPRCADAAADLFAAYWDARAQRNALSVQAYLTADGFAALSSEIQEDLAAGRIMRMRLAAPPVAECIGAAQAGSGTRMEVHLYLRGSVTETEEHSGRIVSGHTFSESFLLYGMVLARGGAAGRGWQIDMLRQMTPHLPPKYVR